jgi:hypothetical protein
MPDSEMVEFWGTMAKSLSPSNVTPTLTGTPPGFSVLYSTW